MEVVPIHSVPHLMKECCELLNMEWKRSETARLRSLTASCDELPTCLVLIQNESDTIKVIGHSKLSKIPTVPEGCFVESVVIHPNLRRRGLGKYLMIKTEDYAKSHGFTSIFLSTHDQEIFYGKLGYSVCPPVSIYGSSIRNKPTKEGTRSPKKEDKPVDMFHCCGKKDISSITLKSPPPPPLPPPMPMSEKYGETKKIFMNKEL
ncbi:hypothetical protein J437_LFUL009735 [Ladona fulva]|uniref:N-acetyltransferase domain-containing protein n=1 Tax=Ladona fulva TaxID=123851 RepID=A0A8K0KBB0_LADFU|nr:hypothetical protein J437_LFUL009735 [Ladona fulva]